MPWGTSASNTLKINKITIISFFTLCRNTTISFHNFVELIPVFKIYLYLCRIDYSLNNIITMKKRHIQYLQPIITQYFIDNKSEIWLLFLIAHSKR